MNKFSVPILILIFTLLSNQAFTQGYCDKTAVQAQKQRSQLYKEPWNSYCENKTVQFEKDTVLLYRTIFPHQQNLELLIEQGKVDYDKFRIKQEFTKRLILALAFFEPKVSNLKNGLNEENVPSYRRSRFPISSLLAHGGRVMFDISITNQDWGGEEFFKFLVNDIDEDLIYRGSLKKLLRGEERFRNLRKREFNQAYQRIKKRKVILPRKAASHRVEFKNLQPPEEGVAQLPSVADDYMYETNWQTKRYFKKFRSMWKTNHFGIDLPYGGLGYLDAFGNMIGPDGSGFHKDSFTVDAGGMLLSISDIGLQNIPNRQHGHVYIYFEDFKEPDVGKVRAALLIGIEGTGPSKVDMWGEKHTALSPVKPQLSKVQNALSKVSLGLVKKAAVHPALTGGNKWKQMPDIVAGDIPHTLGGKKVTMSSRDITDFMTLCWVVLNEAEMYQKQLFLNLLGANPAEAKRMLERALRD